MSDWDEAKARLERQSAEDIKFPLSKFNNKTRGEDIRAALDRIDALEKAMRRIKAEHTKWYEGRGGTGADAIEAVERIACEVMSP